MILALDIGNSRIKVGMAHQEAVTYFALDTRPLRDVSDYISEFNLPEPVEGVIISSVVDELTASFRERLRTQYGKEPFIVNYLLDSGLTYGVGSPEKIGADRIANAVGSYFSGNGPSIVVDLGTATTVSIVGKGAEFLGGSILPGADVMAEALSEKTSRLPRIDLALPRSVIGKDTQESIRSGIFFGTAGAVERVIEEIQREIPYPMKVILTGGMGEVFRGLIRSADAIDPLLTMKGLFLIYERARNRTAPERIGPRLSERP